MTNLFEVEQAERDGLLAAICDHFSNKIHLNNNPYLMDSELWLAWKRGYRSFTIPE